MVSLAAIGMDEEQARRLVERHRGPVEGLTLEAERLRGGLEAAAVARVTARFGDGTGRRHVWRWVVKRLPPGWERELAIHRRLEAVGAGFAPELLEVGVTAGGARVLHMEWIRPYRRWPWRDLAVTRDVMRRLARIHAELEDHLRGSEVPPWDYDEELARSAEATLDYLERLPGTRTLAQVRRAIPAARRIAEDLPRIRRELMDRERPGGTWIHGDLHPSNVLVRTRDRRPAPVLVDWGRARRGSPFEDLSSWMLSLAHWEPKAKRRHDRLLRDYLEAAGRPAALGDHFRDAYWLAAACNALAGALRHHLLVAAEAATDRAHDEAIAAARPWLRALRRADVRWRATA